MQAVATSAGAASSHSHQQQQHPTMANGSASASSAPDDFERAVLLTFDPLLPAGGIKAAAQSYCDAIRSSADGWRLCLSRLHALGASPQGSEHVKFFCLSTLHAVSEARYPTMNDEEKSVLRRSLMLFVRDVVPAVPQSPFIKNKLCAIFVHIVKHDYPQHWPSFFTDFLSLLDKGPEVIDVFVRLLKILDEEVRDTTPRHATPRAARWPDAHCRLRTATHARTLDWTDVMRCDADELVACADGVRTCACVDACASGGGGGCASRRQ